MHILGPGTLRKLEKMVLMVLQESYEILPRLNGAMYR